MSEVLSQPHNAWVWQPVMLNIAIIKVDCVAVRVVRKLADPTSETLVIAIKIHDDTDPDDSS